jgi:hypothetical protein
MGQLQLSHDMEAMRKFEQIFWEVVLYGMLSLQQLACLAGLASKLYLISTLSISSSATVA